MTWERLESVYKYVQTRTGMYEEQSHMKHFAKRTVTAAIQPPRPHELVAVTKQCFQGVKDLLESANERERERIGKYEVATINRYFVALICMKCGQRPGVPEYLKEGELTNGYFERDWYIFHGHHHKTTRASLH